MQDRYPGSEHVGEVLEFPGNGCGAAAVGFGSDGMDFGTVVAREFGNETWTGAAAFSPGARSVRPSEATPAPDRGNAGAARGRLRSRPHPARLLRAPGSTR